MPSQSTDIWAAMTAAFDMVTTNPYLKAEMEILGIKPLLQWTSGWDYLALSKEPINSIADMKGKVARVYAAGEITLCEELGIVPAQIWYSAIYEGLDRGTIDLAGGFCFALSDQFKHYEVGKYMFMLRTGTSLAAPDAISVEVWNSFPKDIQNIMYELSFEYLDRFARVSDEAEAEIIERWKAEGVEFTYPSEEDRERFNEALIAVHEQGIIEAEGMPGGQHAREVYTSFRKLVEQYELEVAEKGHPWER